LKKEVDCICGKYVFLISETDRYTNHCPICGLVYHIIFDEKYKNGIDLIPTDRAKIKSH
jgi:hypothetical protein